MDNNRRESMLLMFITFLSDRALATVNSIQVNLRDIKQDMVLVPLVW
jgi:hypothetical protein